MKMNNMLRTSSWIGIMLLMAIGISCTETESPLQQEASYVAEDAIIDAYFEDVDDLAGIVVGSADATAGNTGRMSETIVVTDLRICEDATLTLTIDEEASAPGHPVGDIVIDFGTEGCEGPGGNVRKGKILIHFEGRRFLPESVITTTFENYEINGIKLEGTRTLTNISESTEEAPIFQVELENGKAIWPDATEATRTHCFIREWVREPNPINDVLKVSQCGDAANAASGTNRRGRSYTMSILTTLEYKRCAPIAVKGVKQFVADGRTISIDYGDGACDRIVTLTVEGTVRTVSVANR